MSFGNNMTVAFFLNIISVTNVQFLLLSVSPVERIRSRNEGQFLLSFQLKNVFYILIIIYFIYIYSISLMSLFSILFCPPFQIHPLPHPYPPPLFYKQTLYWWITCLYTGTTVLTRQVAPSFSMANLSGHALWQTFVNRMGSEPEPSATAAAVTPSAQVSLGVLGSLN